MSTTIINNTAQKLDGQHQQVVGAIRNLLLAEGYDNVSIKIAIGYGRHNSYKLSKDLTWSEFMMADIRTCDNCVVRFGKPATLKAVFLELGNAIDDYYCVGLTDAELHRAEEIIRSAAK